ncbi:MAG: signal peptidase I [Spirochaetia bacterium]|jgi:signal peptidase I|nr:signal peptidase I [Spirochaetia bacterium]
MDAFLTKVEGYASRYLTKRKALKLYERQHAPKRTFLGELKGWVDAILFAVVVIFIINLYLFQLFVIPSPSMEKTLLIGDRVFVNKNIYGMELYPDSKKIFTANRRVHRDDIITFYNPDYHIKGPLFDTLSQLLFSATFSLVNIDKNADGTPAERLLVKRCAALEGDTVRFVDGNVLIRPAGSADFQKETAFRSKNGLSDGPNRTLDSSYYTGLRAWGSLIGYQDLKYSSNQAPSYLLSAYTQLKDNKYPRDMYQFEASRTLSKSLLRPDDFTFRSDAAKYQLGVTVPEGCVLPLGDNRDDSSDGRYFGPISQEKVNGRVLARFWPLNRIAYLGNK